ncbi:MAG: hypothetical protein OJF51_004337 [Nitrospira sp.]|nr:MAG: hypothetical protein OJF51_004337 [Nitrospira sp.]
MNDPTPGYDITGSRREEATVNMRCWQTTDPFQTAEVRPVERTVSRHVVIEALMETRKHHDAF